MTRISRQASRLFLVNLFTAFCLGGCGGEPIGQIPPDGTLAIVDWPAKIWQTPDQRALSVDDMSYAQGEIARVSKKGLLFVSAATDTAFAVLHSDRTRRDTVGFVLRDRLERVSSRGDSLLPRAILVIPSVSNVELRADLALYERPSMSVSSTHRLGRGTWVSYEHIAKRGWAAVFDDTLIGYARRAPLDLAAEQTEKTLADDIRADECSHLDDFANEVASAEREAISADGAEERRNGAVIPGKERRFTASEERKIRSAIDLRLRLEASKQACGR